MQLDLPARAPPPPGSGRPRPGRWPAAGGVSADRRGPGRGRSRLARSRAQAGTPSSRPTAAGDRRIAASWAVAERAAHQAATSSGRAARRHARRRTGRPVGSQVGEIRRSERVPDAETGQRRRPRRPPRLPAAAACGQRGRRPTVGAGSSAALQDRSTVGGGERDRPGGELLGGVGLPDQPLEGGQRLGQGGVDRPAPRTTPRRRRRRRCGRRVRSRPPPTPASAPRPPAAPARRAGGPATASRVATAPRSRGTSQAGDRGQPRGGRLTGAVIGQPGAPERARSGCRPTASGPRRRSAATAAESVPRQRAGAVGEHLLEGGPRRGRRARRPALVAAQGGR